MRSTRNHWKWKPKLQPLDKRYERFCYDRGPLIGNARFELLYVIKVWVMIKENNISRNITMFCGADEVASEQTQAQKIVSDNQEFRIHKKDDIKTKPLLK